MTEVPPQPPPTTPQLSSGSLRKTWLLRAGAVLGLGLGLFLFLGFVAKFVFAIQFGLQQTPDTLLTYFAIPVLGIALLIAVLLLSRARGASRWNKVRNLLVAAWCLDLIGFVTTPALIQVPTFSEPTVEVGRVVYQWSVADKAAEPFRTHDDQVLRSRYLSGIGYEIDFNKADSYWSAAHMDTVRDMRVEADFIFQSALGEPPSAALPAYGSNDSVPGAGIMCRAFPDQWYFFGVWMNGDVAIFRIRGLHGENELQVPAEGPHRLSDGMTRRIPITDNLHLAANCVGGENYWGPPIKLTFDVNGVRVLSAIDSSPGELSAPGRAGIMVTSGSKAPVVVVYTNFVVHELRVLQR